MTWGTLVAGEPHGGFWGGSMTGAHSWALWWPASSDRTRTGP